MRNRREFLSIAASAAPGTLLLAHDSVAARLFDQARPAKRRQVSIAGRRTPVIDIHAHCVIPVQDIVKGTPLEKSGGAAGNLVVGPSRIEQMDRAGIDIQALSINGYWWYAADRELATRIVGAQNEGLATIVRANPERFVGLASVSLQYPDLAAQQLHEAVTRLDLRGTSIGGHVNGEDLSLPKYDPF
jgi:aminocarboxymuconate-semialdehyde decarboxylase